MEVPDDNWHREIFSEEDLELLREEYSATDEDIKTFAENCCNGGLVPGQGVENLAYLIGEFAYSNHSKDGFFVEVIDNEVDGREGEKLAKAYIGIQALSDIEN
jgi:hypothetical protein